MFAYKPLQWLLLFLLPQHLLIQAKLGVPAGWTAVTAQPGDSTTAVFSLALSMGNVSGLEAALLAVSDPESANYGQFLTAEEVTAAFGPTSATVDAVTDWLQRHGVTRYAVDGLFVDFVANLSTANSMLTASYQIYTNGIVKKLRTSSYMIPQNLQEHIALVDPGTFMGSETSAARSTARHQKRPTSRRNRLRTWSRSSADGTSNTTVAASCQSSITPQCLKQMYAVNYAPSMSSGSRVGFASFLNQSAQCSDLADYEALYGIPAQNFSVELIAGGTNVQNETPLSNVGGGSRLTEFITGGLAPLVPDIDQPNATENQNEPYLSYYRHLISKSNRELPQVISQSYGDIEDSVPHHYAVHVCNMIATLGLRGISIIVSSGDIGVGAGCLEPNNKTVEFNAIFPASCPYVTAVGGTVNVTPEVAWPDSSGGFSRYFRRPSYQDSTIKSYLSANVSAETLSYYGKFTNFSGRGFPDISAHSVSPAYNVVYLGNEAPSGGTSAAAPVVAVITGMLNDARLRAGKKPLGWLNPLLYRKQGMLTDIKAGYSVGCDGVNGQSGAAEPNGSGIVPGARWNATTGWDPVTGLGTPNFEKMLKTVMAL